MRRYQRELITWVLLSPLRLGQLDKAEQPRLKARKLGHRPRNLAKGWRNESNNKKRCTKNHCSGSELKLVRKVMPYAVQTVHTEKTKDVSVTYHWNCGTPDVSDQFNTVLVFQPQRMENQETSETKMNNHSKFPIEDFTRWEILELLKARMSNYALYFLMHVQILFRSFSDHVGFFSNDFRTPCFPFNRISQ